jgi:sulfur-carrier protein adenylyltransferase/sulfurtransferase
MSNFSKQELERYSRHIIIPEFGMEGQRKLKEAKVLVVGTGGLGSPVLLYLAAAGVGTVGIVDFDKVDDSNLQRQVLFGVGDVGRPKVDAAADRLRALNPYITINTYNLQLHSSNALDILKDYDLVADGTDNFPTRYLVNDAAVLLGKTNVYASIFRFDGQVTVFNYKYADGTFGPNYRDLYPTPPPPGLVPSCAEGGVLGVLPGIIGSLQASEVIKVITGIGEPLIGKLYLFDALSFESRTLKFKKDPNAPKIEKLIDYEQFCGIEKPAVETAKKDNTVKEISVTELKALKDQGADFQLIDVREEYEYDIANLANLGAELIPLATVPVNAERIAKGKQVIIHCRSGARSANAVRLLESQFGFDNLYNLKGGILAYADEVDTSLAKY